MDNKEQLARDSDEASLLRGFRTFMAHVKSNQLTMADFKTIGSKQFEKREKELSSYRVPADEMYTGQQHVRLMRGLKLIADSSEENIKVDLKILFGHSRSCQFHNIFTVIFLNIYSW